MELETNLCLDIIVFGNCTKRKGCEICNKDANSKPIIFSNLDVNANEYIPKKKIASNKIKETAIQNAVSDEINNKSNKLKSLLKKNLLAEGHDKSADWWSFVRLIRKFY